MWATRQKCRIVSVEHVSEWTTHDEHSGADTCEIHDDDTRYTLHDSHSGADTCEHGTTVSGLLSLVSGLWFLVPGLWKLPRITSEQLYVYCYFANRVRQIDSGLLSTFDCSRKLIADFSRLFNGAQGNCAITKGNSKGIRLAIDCLFNRQQHRPIGMLVANLKWTARPRGHQHLRHRACMCTSLKIKIHLNMGLLRWEWKLEIKCKWN